MKPSTHNLRNPAHSSIRTKSSGFSLIEVLVAIAILGIIASVAFVSVGNVANVAKGEKIRSESASLNSAINTYLANGGSLDGLTTAEQVLAKLKTQRPTADAKRHTGGPSGRMIDPRIIALPVAAGDAQLRAIYNATDKRFEVVSSGAGVRFDLDESLNELASMEETREHAAVMYASNDSWVWDYNNSLTNPTGDRGSTYIPTSTAPTDSVPPSTTDPIPAPDPDPVTDPDPFPDPLPQLGTPSISPERGYYPPADFPIAVTIGNAPPSDRGRLAYRIGSGAWKDYSGEELSITRDTQLSAQAIALDPASYRDSNIAYALYTIPSPPKLPTPIFSLPGGAYPSTSFPISVALNNVPNPATATAMYQLNSDPWTPYAGSITVPKNTTLRGRYETTDTDLYLTSDTRSEFYYPVANDLQGRGEAKFENVEGGPNLVFQLADAGKFFSHGDPTLDLGGEIVDAGETNTLRFEPGPGGTLAVNQPFKIGDIYYHNGTTFNDSHASAVDLKVKLIIDGHVFPIQIPFTLNLALVNTENSTNPEASADYVKLTNLSQAIQWTLDDVKYSVSLGFGGTDSFGFSTNDEFHVYEGATGRGSLNLHYTATPVP